MLMKKATLVLSALLLIVTEAPAVQFPVVEQVVYNQNLAVGRSFIAPNALLSGTITPYAAAGRELSYLTVQIDGKLQGGFFIAPPEIAAVLSRTLNPNRNYAVNFVYSMRRVPINGFAPALGVITRIDFLDYNGQVIGTVAVR
jgi:hypothetical protein